MTSEPTPLVTVLPCEADSAAAKECWNALADADNDWDALSVDEQLALIEAFARHAANTRLAALEAAAKHLRKIADEPASADDTGQQCAWHICLHFAADEVCALAHHTPGDSPCK